MTYQACWTTNSNLTGFNPLGSSGTSTSRSFNVDTEGMPRGTVIYFTSRATVNGTNATLATPLSWTAPAKTSAAPANVLMQ